MRHPRSANLAWSGDNLRRRKPAHLRQRVRPFLRERAQFFHPVLPKRCAAERFFHRAGAPPGCQFKAAIARFADQVNDHAVRFLAERVAAPEV